MNKQIVRVGLSIGAVASIVVPALFAPALLPACIGSSAADGGAASSGSSSGSSSGASSGSSSGGDAGLACMLADAGPVDPSCLIDDMTNVASETGGYWYTYSDRTIPFQTTLVMGAQGTVNPQEGAQYLPSDGTSMDGGPGPMVPGNTGPMPFREFSGGGLVLWGAGMGMDFTDQVPADAGAADAAAADGGGVLGVPVALATMHNGVAFWGKSNTGAKVTVGVHLADNREANGGGVCIPPDGSAGYTVFDGGADLVSSKTECGDDFLKNETFTTQWQQFSVTWAQFGKTQGYSGTTWPSVDTSKLFYLHFQVNNAGYAGKGPIAPEPPFDISIAYVTWYDGK